MPNNFRTVSRKAMNKLVWDFIRVGFGELHVIQNGESAIELRGTRKDGRVRGELLTFASGAGATREIHRYSTLLVSAVEAADKKMRGIIKTAAKNAAPAGGRKTRMKSHYTDNRKKHYRVVRQPSMYQPSLIGRVQMTVPQVEVRLRHPNRAYDTECDSSVEIGSPWGKDAN